ncbi:hypothetical protein [Microcoleus sp. FACHB-672]|uniref:hypothetical protein n=1 Tax=Microcoleus sp. FACHB-672 TaxID=2692825 RepID=UPI001682DCA4|nr:hypothetical protein [Microcoleus sp. FACHB-672]MBD2043260.1 hypothetical protein [Microcoleus sp. FACHB-672]
MVASACRTVAVPVAVENSGNFASARLFIADAQAGTRQLGSYFPQFWGTLLETPQTAQMLPGKSWHDYHLARVAGNVCKVFGRKRPPHQPASYSE